MKNLSYLILALFFSNQIQAQISVSYDDVAVIINDNSPASIEIGNYFQQQRSIPDLNMIHINGSVEEEIDDSTFESIRTQIEGYLIDNNLEDQINYLVTTKGVPVRINRGNCDDPAAFHGCNAFDSELTLLLSANSNEIGTPGAFQNNYFEEEVHFSRDEYGIYLVTRLDGYTTEDVISLIDRSGPQTPVNQLNSISIFDVSYISDPINISHFYSLFIAPSIEVISSTGWPYIYHPDTTVLTNQQNVFGYFSVNYAPANTQLNYTWKRGSIADIWYEESASTFDVNNNPDNNLVIANLIAEGATGAHGYAYFTFTQSSMEDGILYNRYTNENEDYNLAESYYMAIEKISWQSVVVGDPKTSIVIDNTISVGQAELENRVEVFPNPNNGRFTIQSEGLELSEITIFNQLGQVTFSSKPEIAKTVYEIDLTNHSTGMYFLELETDKGKVSRKIVIKE